MKSLAAKAHENKNVTLRSIIEMTCGSYHAMIDDVAEKLTTGHFVTTFDDRLTVGPVDSKFAIESAEFDDGWRVFDSANDAASSFIKKYRYSCSL